MQYTEPAPAALWHEAAARPLPIHGPPQKERTARYRFAPAAIRQKRPAPYRSVDIDTVERFQGSERDVIIVSFAVKNPMPLKAIQSINAEGVDRKLTVAITRAREHLVMMGVREVVGQMGALREVVEMWTRHPILTQA